MIGVLCLVSMVWAVPEVVDYQPDLSNPKVRLETQLEVLEGLVDNGMHEQALSMIGEVRKQGARDVRLDLIQGRAMHLAGLDDEALALVQKVTKKHPSHGEALAALGLMYADAGRVNDAVDALKRAARILPDDADIQNNLGFALLAQGNAELAAGCFRKALALDPGSVATRNNLGFALVRLDRYDEALKAFRTGNGEADARYNLGVACEMHDDRAGALTSYQAAISAQPGHAAAVEALSRLLKEGSP